MYQGNDLVACAACPQRARECSGFLGPTAQADYRRPYMSVPVIDLFAGPGGLGEGFSRVKKNFFEIAVSIEKDGMAFETLQLRAAYRALKRMDGISEATWDLWDRSIETAPWNIVFEILAGTGDPAITAACAKARREAWNFELGPMNREAVSKGIRERLKPFLKQGRLPDNAVLIGGPPCQAYSVVGRSRRSGAEGYVAEEDHRHFLYKEYLHVIAEFEPAVFIMENVKGILSARVQERHIFETITEDLRLPAKAAGIPKNKTLQYVLVALPPKGDLFDDSTPDDFLIRAEEYGVPQARHRVIICGIRQDVYERAGVIRHLRPAPAPTVGEVLHGLPELRPQLSYRGKGMTWLQALTLPLFDAAARELRHRDEWQGQQVADRMELAREQILAKSYDPGPGEQRFRSAVYRRSNQGRLTEWYRDRRSNLLTNHESRSHMPTDLVRYLFVSTFGNVTGESPRLSDFPHCLLPDHRNVDKGNLSESIFKDRFRVQLANRHSMTVTSHIGKDGHAFIHPDPTQCRSLTVREAARLQTFPDTYVFLGSRTSQYTQVGNAVPPYLAHQIAMIVESVLKRAALA